MRHTRVVTGLMWVMLGAIGTSPMQAGQNGKFPPVGPPPFDPSARDPADPMAGRLQEQQAKNRNDDRQKRLVSDTAKLFELAAQLKEQVAKTDKNTLSIDVVKKAEEIERLARSIKERMRR